MRNIIPAEIIASPVLIFLYHRIEQILGIKATGESLVKLNEYLERNSEYSFVENPAAYTHALNSREHVFEISKFFTVNETYFFREESHFDVLARHFLPQLVKLNRPIQICSAATSIGCEAYSIAMLLDYHAKNGCRFDFEIDAFDINVDAIKMAKDGRYTANTLRADGASWKYILDSYLVSNGAEYIVSPDIRRKVHFYPHNIMRGLDKQYDVIFFRNALIYFSYKNRRVIINDIAESLADNGVLFLGISETSSVSHPSLVSHHLSDVFFFQKMLDGEKQRGESVRMEIPQPVKKTEPQKRMDLPIHCGEVTAILETEEGQPNAKKILETLTQGKNPAGSELAAAVMYFLGIQDFNSADMVLSYLEQYNSGAVTLFLRGEYYLLRGETKNAEQCFVSAAGKDRAFWPAFYRIASLAAEGNTTRYKYKIKKAIESIELSQDYECFMGGFSPDYFKRVLTKERVCQAKT
ncbi:MAG: hypothetical protein FWD36_01590 [Treponema sp.]|nr:hypothetical protein [Treponema sp.]